MKMNKLFIPGVIILLITIVACNQGQKKAEEPHQQIDSENIMGKWSLREFSRTGIDTSIQVSDCDHHTAWNFTREIAPKLGDTLPAKILRARAPDTCNHHGFEARWAVYDGKLYITATRINGLEGISNAGWFDIIHLDERRMVIDIMRNRYTFVKI